jgi:hypothetical protein
MRALSIFMIPSWRNLTRELELIFYAGANRGAWSAFGAIRKFSTMAYI